jgi:O-antigen/teichoic acid export membrane protein
MSWASAFVRFGSMIFVLPLVLTAYSDIEQSLWFLTSTIIAFAMLADSGFGSVLVRAVAYFNAGSETIPKTKQEFEDREEIANNNPNFPKLIDLLTTSNRIYLFLGGLIILLLGTLGVAFVWNLMELSGHRVDFWLAFLLLIPYCYISILNVKWSSFSRGLGFVAMEARLNTILSTVRVMLFIVLLLLKMKPAILIALMLFELIIKQIYLRRFVLNWFRDNNAVVRRTFYFDKEIFQSIWPASWKLAGIFWGNFLVDSGNTIIIAQISDTRLMSSFLFTTRIVSFVRNISQTPFYANTPGIYKLVAQKKLDVLKARSSEYIFTGMFIFIAACLGIAIFGNWALSLLDTSTRFLEPELFLIMCLSVMLDLHASFHATIYTSTNHIPFLIPSLISGALIIGLGFLVLPIYGLVGILMVRFIVQMSFNNWYAVYVSLKLLNWPFLRYLTDVPKKGVAYIYDKAIEFNIFKRR